MNIHFIAELLAKTPEAVLDGLLTQNLVFDAPIGCIKPGLVMSNDYLTGDIGTKLAVAKRAAQRMIAPTRATSKRSRLCCRPARS